MATLQVDLAVGFSDDEVIVAIDGQRLTSHENVTTNYSVGLAASDRHPDIEPGEHDLEVSIPNRALNGRQSITVAEDTLVVVSVDGGSVTIATPTERSPLF